MSHSDYCRGLTDRQLLNVVDDDKDRYQRYLDEAGGDENGYRVAELKADHEASKAEAERRGIL